MDALGRVTEGQPPRPDPILAPAYLALMPLRASAVRVRRGRTPRPSPGYAGYATRKAPPSPEQAGKGAVGQSTAPRHWQSVPLRHSDGRAATRCRTRHRALHVERTAAGPALRVGPRSAKSYRRGEERSGANPRPHGWKEVGPVGRSGEVGQVHTSGLDQEHHPESLPHAVNGTRPWAGNCGSRWHDWSECLQPGRRQSCRMAVSVAGRAQRGVGRGARHSIDDSDHS